MLIDNITAKLNKLHKNQPNDSIFALMNYMNKLFIIFFVTIFYSFRVHAQPTSTVEIPLPTIPTMRLLHHDLIDKNQQMICSLDGVKDSLFLVGTTTQQNDSINNALTVIVNNMQALVELNQNLTEADKYIWLRGINEMLTTFISTYQSKNIEGKLIYQLITSYNVAMQLQWKNESIEQLIQHNEMIVGEMLIDNCCLKNNIGVPFSKEILLLKKIQKFPDRTIQILTQYPNVFFADSIITSIAYQSPEKLYNYAAAPNALGKKIQTVNNPLVKKIGLLALMKTGRMYFPFLDNLYHNTLTIDSITNALYDTVAYYKLLVQTQINYVKRLSKKDTPIVMHLLTEKLKSKSIELFINEINALHDESQEPIRFKCLEKLSPEDLYYLIVLGEQEIYTSSYLGVYKRMFDKMQIPSADTLLAWVHYDYYKKFLKIAANYNTLDDFLSKIDQTHTEPLIKSFVSGLENTATLEDAVDIANSYASISNTAIQKIMLLQIAENLATSKKLNNTRAQNIYGLLYTIFNSINSTANIDIAKALLIDGVYTMPNKSLEDSTHRIIIQQFFYGDKDGKAIFNSFFKNYPPTIWKKIDTTNWIELRSIKGARISIFCNKPFDNEDDLDIKAQNELSTYLETSNLKPTIIIHRGHSYYVDNTIQQLPSSAKVILLGSCGGYQRLREVLDNCENAHIISTKQTGAGMVNIALILAITENLRLGKDLDWLKIWKSLEPKFKGETKEKFEDYIPPYKNLGAIFITAYKQMMQHYFN